MRQQLRFAHLADDAAHNSRVEIGQPGLEQPHACEGVLLDGGDHTGVHGHGQGGRSR